MLILILINSDVMNRMPESMMMFVKQKKLKGIEGNFLFKDSLRLIKKDIYYTWQVFIFSYLDKTENGT
jgi:hypothetical protein